MKNLIPMTKLTPSVKHKVWSETIITNRIKVPEKILKILKWFIRKTDNNIITNWIRVEIFKYKNYWFWEPFVYMVCIYKTWFGWNYNYWAWTYLTTLYFSKDWICLNDVDSEWFKEYLYYFEQFTKSNLMYFQNKKK